MRKILYFLSLFCCGMSHVDYAMVYRGEMIDSGPVQFSISETLAKKYLGTKQEMGFFELVMYKRDNGSYCFARIEEHEGDYYHIRMLDSNECVMVTGSDLQSLAFLWRCIYQPYVPLCILSAMINAYLSKFVFHNCSYIKTVSVNPDSHYLVLSDIHGDIKALTSILHNWYIRGFIDKNLVLKKGYTIIGTGDYQERGENGVEVWYVLLALVLQNPGHVFLIRGNHEDKEMLYGGLFLNEWQEKFGANKDSRMVWDSLTLLVSKLPDAVLLGLKKQDAGIDVCNFVMFCHGGIPESLDMKSVMIKHKGSSVAKLDHPIDPAVVYAIHWTDFFAIKLQDKKGEDYPVTRLSNRQTGLQDLSQDAFARYIKRCATHVDIKNHLQLNLWAIIRGHQHLRGGVVQLKDSWLDDGAESSMSAVGARGESEHAWRTLAQGEEHILEQYGVYTITSAPVAIGLPEYNVASFALVHGTQHGDWRLTPMQVSF